MDMPSAFNWDFDLHLPRYTGTSLSEYWFNFILMNIVFFVVYQRKDSKQQRKISWLLVILFLLYAFWDTDYFSFARTFYEGLDDFRDPIYQYISNLSFNSYLIFRLWIWGGGLYITYLTAKKLNLNPNTFLYVFTIFFLLTFSYARVSLGMALYFYGLSFLIIPHSNILKKYIAVFILFFLAFLAHRSILILIVLAPVSLVKLTKKRLILIILLSPIVIFATKYILGSIIAGALLAGNNSEFAKSAHGYAASKIQMTFNWKWELITTLRYYSFYVSIAFALWKFYFSKDSIKPSRDISKYLTISFFIILIAVTILCVAGNQIMGLWIIGYRYLYMAGIPLCFIITYLYQNRFITNKVLSRLLLLPFLYSELFMIGKIITLQFGKIQ